MTRSLEQYVKASPWEALIQLINDNFDFALSPSATTLVSLSHLDDEGSTRVTLSSSRGKQSGRYLPPFTSHVFNYTRLDLGVYLHAYDGHRFIVDSYPISTVDVVKRLSKLTGIPFDKNDFKHYLIEDDSKSKFTLEAHPYSLRWIGKITFTAGRIVDSFKSSTPGDYSVSLKSGTYSVLGVGGGGSGSKVVINELPNESFMSTGGGSGEAFKGRITVTDEDEVRVIVGNGATGFVLGPNYEDRNVLHSPSNVSGGPSAVYVNGTLVFQGNGGKNSRPEENGRTWNAEIMNGGNGASGGGGGPLFRGLTYLIDKVSQVPYTSPPTNGGDDGKDGATSANRTSYSCGVGGKGLGEGYYQRIMSSIDPDITHGITNPSSTGGVAVTRNAFLDYYMGSRLITQRVTVGLSGGGGGLGDTYHGKEDILDGVAYRIDGTGYGAGGGGGHDGINGFVSIQPIS